MYLFVDTKMSTKFLVFGSNIFAEQNTFSQLVIMGYKIILHFVFTLINRFVHTMCYGFAGMSMLAVVVH